MIDHILNIHSFSPSLRPAYGRRRRPSSMQIHAQRRDKRVAHAHTERKYADNYNKWHNKSLVFLKL